MAAMAGEQPRRQDGKCNYFDGIPRKTQSPEYFDCFGFAGLVYGFLLFCRGHRVVMMFLNRCATVSSCHFVPEADLRVLGP